MDDIEATAAIEQTPNNTKRKRINYALAATLVASGLTLQEAAEKTGAKNANVLQVGLARKGVIATVARKMPLVGSASMSLTMRVASEASEVLRDKFASVLDKATDSMGLMPIKPNYKSLKRFGEVIEPLARTAKIVHGWDSDSKPSMLMVGQIEQMEQQGAIDVTSTPQEPQRDNEAQSPV